MTPEPEPWELWQRLFSATVRPAAENLETWQTVGFVLATNFAAARVRLAVLAERQACAEAATKRAAEYEEASEGCDERRDPLGIA